MIEDLLLYLVIFCTSLLVVTLLLSKNILSIVIINSAFSIFTMLMYLLLDAPDVAMTEAAVGSITTVLSIFLIKRLYTKPYVLNDTFKPYLFILLLFAALLLIYAGLSLPDFGYPRFDPYYLQNTIEDIKINSAIAAILASYRGYDTLLETLVIVIGGISVLFMMDINFSSNNKQDNLIAKMSRVTFPCIILFAMYLQMHGEVSPGGGFQSGAMIALALILYDLANNKLLSIFSINLLKYIALSGLGIYFFTGISCLVAKGSFLDYNAILDQKLGIMLVESGVCLSVFSTILIIYLGLSNASSES